MIVTMENFYIRRDDFSVHHIINVEFLLTRNPQINCEWRLLTGGVLENNVDLYNLIPGDCVLAAENVNPTFPLLSNKVQCGTFDNPTDWVFTLHLGGFRIFTLPAVPDCPMGLYQPTNQSNFCEDYAGTVQIFQGP